MQSFTAVDKTSNKTVGFLSPTDGGECITPSQFEQLKPYILFVLKHKQGIYSGIHFPADQLSNIEFEHRDNTVLITLSEGKNQAKLIDTIDYMLHWFISEKIIVEQCMGNGPSIRHRPLQFVKNKECTHISVRFYEWNCFNTFEKAISLLRWTTKYFWNEMNKGLLNANTKNKELNFKTVFGFWF